MAALSEAGGALPSCRCFVASALPLRFLTVAALIAAFVGCEAGRRDFAGGDAGRFYPPQPQVPRVVALGTLRGAPPPSQVQVDLALFLFGAEPPPPLTIANPTGLAAQGSKAWICDNALNTVFRWDADGDRVCEEACDPPLEHPFAVDVMPDGDRLICDRSGVRRVDATGHRRCTYEFSGEFRPGGVLAVNDTVWVTNLARHEIEVFDAASGHLRRTLGEHGRGPGQFQFPRSLAHMPDGNVCVVDLLNYRLQVLTPEGEWVRSIGQHGDSPGAFSRPKDVAVGPDGTIFVTDAFAQRVHALASDGTPLMTFGEPQSGVGELTLPSGIAISSRAPRTAQKLPPDTQPAYYVLVSEQLNDPGIRVYAWLGAQEGSLLGFPARETAANWKPRLPGAVAINPHWDPERCTKCHQSAGGRLQPIALEETDKLCLSCHDGVQSFADPHPIGRPVSSELVSTPDGFPAIRDTIGCLTCHDIERHCDPAARRPAVNPKLLRNYDPQRALEYCGNCHRTEVGRRFSPHRQRDATGRVRDDACLFCHTHRPEVPADGQRRFEPHLRSESSQLCMNCHVRHWDLSPLGHVDRPVPPAIREWMLIRELYQIYDSTPAELAKRLPTWKREPARLPLASGTVACYTCHNPHYAGLFPADSELGTLATSPAERASALRANWIDLCSNCHHR